MKIRAQIMQTSPQCQARTKRKSKTRKREPSDWGSAKNDQRYGLKRGRLVLRGGEGREDDNQWEPLGTSGNHWKSRLTRQTSDLQRIGGLTRHELLESFWLFGYFG